MMMNKKANYYWWGNMRRLCERELIEQTLTGGNCAFPVEHRA